MEKITADLEKILSIVAITNMSEDLDRKERVRNAQKAQFESSSGICSNCVHAEGCTLNPYLERKVINCGEFEPFPPKKRALNVQQVKTELSGIIRKKKAEQNYKTEYLGICKYCVNREHCTFPRPESGVWTCDEYEE